MTYRISPPGFIAAVAALAALLSMPTPARANDSDHHGGYDDRDEPTKSKTVDRDFMFNDASPCTGDEVTGVGRRVFTEEFTTHRFKTTEFVSGKGNGAPSGARYELSSKTEHETFSSARTFVDEMETRKHLIRTSGGAGISKKNDDLFIREFVLMKVTNGQPDINVEKTRMECK